MTDKTEDEGAEVIDINKYRKRKEKEKLEKQLENEGWTRVEDPFPSDWVKFDIEIGEDEDDNDE